MIDEVAMQLALRARAMTLSVATTGVMSLSATSTGYARTAGDFQADGFAAGMETIAAGFANNGPAVITKVTPLAIEARRVIATTVGGVTVYALAAPPVEAAASGRSLVAGLPSHRSWENIAFQPTAGVPWVREEFIPGPVTLLTIGPNGSLEATPMYALHVHVPDETGLTAKRYVTALRVLFAPCTTIPVSNGDTLHVRADTGPFAGQLQQAQPGFAVQPFTIPLRVHSINTI